MVGSILKTWKLLLCGTILYSSNSFAGDCHVVQKQQVIQRVVSYPYFQTIQVPVPLQYYYSFGSEQQREKLVEDQEAFAQKVAEEVVRRLKEEASAEGNEVPTNSDEPDLTAKVQEIFNQSCVSCHGATNPQNGLSLTDAKSFDIWDKIKIEAHVTAIGPEFVNKTKKSMPPNKPLSEDKIYLIRKWMQEKK